jgi:ribonuclease HII
MLLNAYTDDLVEAGCDEAGRGCLAGPVFAAAVILPKNYSNDLLNDSKQISENKRQLLRKDIEANALAWQVASCNPGEIDEMNILNASFEAMHRALANLLLKPELILVDGNRFRPFPDIPHHCIVKGDGIFSSIAAASILAKTYRDDYMQTIDLEHPEYHWKQNKGYPSREHRDAIARYGITPHHRKSFRLNEQMKLDF